MFYIEPWILPYNLQTQTIVAAPQSVTLPVTQTGQNVLVLGPSGYTQTTQVLHTAPGQPQVMSGVPGQPQVMSGVPGQPVMYLPGQPQFPQATAPAPAAGMSGGPQLYLNGPRGYKRDMKQDLGSEAYVEMILLVSLAYIILHGMQKYFTGIL